MSASTAQLIKSIQPGAVLEATGPFAAFDEPFCFKLAEVNPDTQVYTFDLWFFGVKVGRQACKLNEGGRVTWVTL